MAKRPLLLIGRHSSYLMDLLITEGIIADKSDKITNTINNYQLAIIANVEFDINEEKEFEGFCKNHGRFIVINLNDNLAKYFGLGKIRDKSETKIRINEYICTAYNPVFYNVKIGLYKDIENRALIFSVWKYDGSGVIFSFDFLKSLYVLTHGKNPMRDECGVFRADSKTIVNESEKLYPQADVLMRCLVSLIEKQIIIPRIWYLPYKKKAGIIFSYDTDNVGNNELEEISKFNKNNNIKTTTFLLLKTGTPKCWKKLVNIEDIQLHQAYMYFPSIGKLSALANKLVSNAITVELQKFLLYMQKIFLELLIRKRILGIRNHGLVWYNNGVLRWMRNANIKFDSSLGSGNRYGYLYGSGLPYFLRFSNNLSSGVLEFPLHFMDHMAYIMGYHHKKKDDYSKLFIKLRKFVYEFINTGIKFNSILTFDFHHKFLMHKEIMEWYRDIIRYAKRKDLMIESMSYFNDFWIKRNNVQIEHIEFGNYILKYKVKSGHKIDGFTQIVPIKFKGKNVMSIKVDNKKISYNKIKSNRAIYAIFEWNLSKLSEVEISHG